LLAQLEPEHSKSRYVLPIDTASHFFFFFQALNFPVESFGLLNDLFPLPSILDVGYPVFGSSFGRCPV
jgi:hypothetical protein